MLESSKQGASSRFPHTYVHRIVVVLCLIMPPPPIASPPCGPRLAVWSPQTCHPHRPPGSFLVRVFCAPGRDSAATAVPALHRPCLEMPSGAFPAPSCAGPTLLSPSTLCISTCLSVSPARLGTHVGGDGQNLFLDCPPCTQCLLPPLAQRKHSVSAGLMEQCSAAQWDRHLCWCG